MEKIGIYYTYLAAGETKTGWLSFEIEKRPGYPAAKLIGQQILNDQFKGPQARKIEKVTALYNLFYHKKTPASGRGKK